MDFPASAFWWAAAGLTIAAELVTGTFYLLMIAMGLSAGALAAHLGWSGSGQLVAAAIVGAGGTALAHWFRSRKSPPLPAKCNHDVNLDVGERVQVVAWAADRTGQVHHRGTTWTVRLHPSAPALPGPHIVQSVEGNWLVVTPVPAT